MLLSWLGAFLFAYTVVSIAIQLFGLGIFLRFFFKQKPRLNPQGPFPGVTVLKPCYLVEDQEALNYEQFFNQDYPGPLQLLFVASRPTDPAALLVQSFIKRYPHVDAKLVISETRKAYWAKIDAVYDGHSHAKHDFFVISDSDTWVGRDYVRQMVAGLQEPGVSLVSTPQWDHGANNFASALKVLANNCDSATFVLIADFFTKRKFVALGHSMAFRLSDFRALGEDKFEIMNSFLAEDLAYAYLFRRAGKQPVLRNIYCPVNFSNKTVKQVYTQKVRWLINQKMAIGNRYLYLLGALHYPEVPALLYCLLSGFSGRGLALFAAASFSRIAIAVVVEGLYLRSIRMSLKYFWTVPLWDLSQLYFFILGFFKTRISYGKKTYRVVNRYFLQEVPS